MEGLLTSADGTTLCLCVDGPFSGGRRQVTLQHGKPPQQLWLKAKKTAKPGSPIPTWVETTWQALYEFDSVVNGTTPVYRYKASVGVGSVPNEEWWKVRHEEFVVPHPFELPDGLIGEKERKRMKDAKDVGKYVTSFVCETFSLMNKGWTPIDTDGRNTK